MVAKPRPARRPKTSKRKPLLRKAKAPQRVKKRTSASQSSKVAPVKRTSAKRAAGTRLRKPAAAKRPPTPRSRLVEAALAAFAHEVRTPLTGILAISSLLATSDLSERERRWVDTIKTGAEHLSALATLYVDAARRGTAGLYVRQELFDLRTLALVMGDALAGRATANGLQSQVVVDDALPIFVSGDVVRLRAALENLIDNAVKFTASGSVGLEVSAKPAAKGKITVAFAISDSGVGLSLAEAKRLFRPFSQANIDVAARFGGAGLGLWSVKQLANAMGGDVRVTSRPGGGAVFTLTVKVVEQRPVVETDAVASGAYPEGLKLLSVEDNPFGRVVLNAILGELGHSVEFVGQGELALERITRGGFDAVLMDMVLPGIDGIETIRRLRALPSPYNAVGIIGISGRAQDEDRARAAGADSFLVKPVSPRALASALREVSARAAVAIS